MEANKIVKIIALGIGAIGGMALEFVCGSKFKEEVGDKFGIKKETK